MSTDYTAGGALSTTTPLHRLHLIIYSGNICHFKLIVFKYLQDCTENCLLGVWGLITKT